jgi:hypothetical protein
MEDEGRCSTETRPGAAGQSIPPSDARSNIDVDDAPAIHRDQVVDVVRQERAPRLRGGIPPPQHVFADAGLSDVDAQLEQLAVDPRGPQSGFSRHMLRMRSLASREWVGLPAWPRRPFRVQNNRKPFRCQVRTVSALTIISAWRQSTQTRDSHDHNRRSAGLSLGRVLDPRCSTPIW